MQIIKPKTDMPKTFIDDLYTPLITKGQRHKNALII